MCKKEITDEKNAMSDGFELNQMIVPCCLALNILN